eukprot:jgi/Mesvir1/5487/Mv26586-RA.1
MIAWYTMSGLNVYLFLACADCRIDAHRGPGADDDEPTFPLLPGKGSVDTSKVPKGAKAAVEKAANAELKRKLSRVAATGPVTGASGAGGGGGGAANAAPGGGAGTRQEGPAASSSSGTAGDYKAAGGPAAKKADAGAVPGEAKNEAPKFSLSFEGKPAVAAVVAIQVPYLVSAKDMKLTTLGLDLMLESATKYAPLKVPLPFFVDSDSAVATFVKHKGELRLYLPFRPVASVLDEMRRKKPHSLGTLELTDSSLLDLD